MEWIDAATAAERLGVKPATLYAYVSRGLLTRRHGDDRRSLFDAAEIERLARRGRPRGQPPELVVESAVTALGLDRPYYRGRDALTLARTSGFEAVAEWLWTGAPAAPAGAPEGAGWWACEEEALRAAVKAQQGLPADLLPLDRLQVITTVLGAGDSLRHQLDPASVAATGRRLIAGLVTALPQADISEPSPSADGIPGGETSGDGLSDDGVLGDGASGGGTSGETTSDDSGDGTSGGGASGSRIPADVGSVAERLWTRLCPRPATPGLLAALEAALVLLADHELAASTLAARVAASARADPYAVVLTGLGVLGGPLHGGASYGAERLLAEVTEPGRAARVIADRVRRGERIPGFGHSVYKNGDARGELLLSLVREAAPGHERLAAAQAVLDEVRRRRLPERNVDFALAALTAVAGMVPGAGEAIFAVARTAGWLAHAMEEYERGSLLRLRASYTGPSPERATDTPSAT
ncbi:citrate synthase [Nonomuraea roseoviolacea]|uniref:citrate synthase (unknown stereospecificity) n=1 Tax=Nonomuraea roseoviolacea subsp. carminata TaxID=160689 RepID=A0ABT1KBB1_9ACTN|nr:citrate synthase [Nonomuraea roseoviolacea]MCP2350254.1 citrate synthase [Nonomuraea roseoviolacea subsp. carminata]